MTLMKESSIAKEMKKKEGGTHR
ncbi:hypothetical protein BSG1_10098 [Bacillus sp. SG-1]|nr:hypothetical protein BSG1_10098 [Bacillus sp. SG-1]